MSEHTCDQCERINDLENRVEHLEGESKKSSDFRKEFYDYQRQLDVRNAVADTQLIDINTKLDKLLAWQEEQKTKPSKRWDGIIDKAIWVVLGAVITYFLKGFGL